MNIYTADISALGWARFPWDYSENSYMHGVVLKYTTLPGGGETQGGYDYDNGDTGVHEIGHYLGLYHTFEGGCTGNGDYVSDTPAEVYNNPISFQCTTNRNTCPNEPGYDDIHNFMNYTDDNCMNHFTAGQIDRIEEKVNEFKPNLGTTSISFTGNLSFNGTVNIGPGFTLTIAAGANITFNGSSSLIINSGASLVVSSNATVKFGTGNLTVNGTLTANGTSGSPITFNSTGASKWGGIKLQSSASSSSSIKYCNINNANQGIYVNLSSGFPTVEHNTITNCNDGIYLYNVSGSSSKPLRYNNVSSSVNGIRIEGITSIGSQKYTWITDNTLKTNTTGMIIRYAHPRVYRNIVTCNENGVKVENYSAPKFAGTSINSSGLNRFADNTYANLYANNHVNVWTGQLNEVDEGRYGGYNTLGSTNDAQLPFSPLFIQANQYSVVMANYSYFGSYPPVSWKIDKDGTSSIDYTNYLNWDPVPGSACSQSAAISNNTNLGSKTEDVFQTGFKKRIGGFATKGVRRSLPSLLLYLGMNHYMQGKVDSAAKVFGSIINNYSDSLESIFAFNWLTRIIYESDTDTLYNFIKDLNQKYSKNKQEKSYALYESSLPLLAEALIRKSDISGGLAAYDKIINDFPESQNAKYALYNKLAYYENVENDDAKAGNIYNELASRFSTDPILADALILLGKDPSEILSKVSLEKSSMTKKKIQKSDEDNLTIENYSLSQNYPNPFNPSTIIQYQIPVGGKVKIVIYDILGKKVEELVNKEQTKGKYLAIFDAARLSSGVYYYKIQVDDSDGTKFFDAKKMLLLK